jgi:hypothetical protein
MPRYAVLHDPHNAARPVALLVESESRVRLISSEQERIFDGDYVATEPDGGPLSLVTYRPGATQYWDYVLLMLSRTYAVGEVGAREALAKRDLEQLFYEKVTARNVPTPKPYFTSVGATKLFEGFSRAESFRRGRGQPARPDPVHCRGNDRRDTKRHRTGGVPIIGA